MRDQFIQLMQTLDPEISAGEIADIIWLACELEDRDRFRDDKKVEKNLVKPDDSVRHPPEGRSSQGVSEEKKTGQKSHHKGFTDKKKTKQSQSPKKTDTPQTRKADLHPKTGTPEKKKSVSSKISALPFQSPGVPALPGRLEIIRAFNPLKRRIPSRNLFELDARETAERMAETGIRWPVMRPAFERWLDAALVVEDSPSMNVWRPAVREFHKLLSGSGLFRHVAFRRFSADEGGEKIRLVTRSGAAASLRGLIDPENRRVILVVSDCVSRLWREGLVQQMFSVWDDAAMTSVVQVMPEYLWDRTGLNRSVSVRFHQILPGAPNSRLSVVPVPDWFGAVQPPKDGLNMPVLALEPAYLHFWSLSIAGLRSAALPGVVFERGAFEKIASEKEKQETGGKPAPTISAEKRVEKFTSTASPLARRLAVFLAAAPLTFPIMRMVQAVMLPESRLVHLAEVMLSGLVFRVTPKKEKRPADDVLYDFAAGVRDELVGFGRVSESLKVLELVFARLGDFVDANIGKTIDFQALLADPSGAGTFFLDEKSRAFGAVSVLVLKRLGGNYAEMAEQLRGNNEKVETGTPSNNKQSKNDIKAFLKEKEEVFGKNKLRVYELASELKVSNSALLSKLHELNIQVRSHMSSLDQNDLSSILKLSKEEFDNLKKKQFKIKKHKSPVESIKFIFESKEILESLKKTLKIPYQGNIIELPIGNKSIPIRFVYIEPGEFMMGSPEDEPGRYNDETLHKVILKQGFYMQETPVTQGQWQEIMGNNPSNFKDGGPACPIEKVSWEDAQRFIQKLNDMKDGASCRLPTEAEWEYTCRAGTITPFWPGKCLNTDQANYDGNNPLEGCPKGKWRERTTPVKKFPPNPWGLYDMHGNIYEWCQDWKGVYPREAVVDPKCSEEDFKQAVRGGSWIGNARNCRSADRHRIFPSIRDSGVGFRLLREAP